jgi:hypothetical protein
MMKKCVWMLLPALCIACAASAQDNSRSATDITGISSSATPVSDTHDLPPMIRDSVSSIITSALGNIADSLKFAAGQVLHFRHVRAAGVLPDSSWDVPMYDLRFQFSDTTPGIRAYEVELRVDHNGRLLFLNWPASGYSDRARLAPWPSVLAFATTFAKRRKFYSAHFQVQLRYNAARGKMLWVFQYPVRDLSKVTMLRTVTIDWRGPELVKEYMDNY